MNRLEAVEGLELGLKLREPLEIFEGAFEKLFGDRMNLKEFAEEEQRFL
jgi:hypothetical protein